MLTKLPNDLKRGQGPIRILYPGLVLGNGDTGLASIGRIDHAHVPAGVTIAMHPHVNDEILSYFRSGRVKHTDSAGFTEFITNQRLMLMKAGKRFYHEETILEGPVEGLQIFIRPAEKDLDPVVDFYNLDVTHSVDRWRLIASPEDGDGLLKLRSQTWIYDRTVQTATTIALPEFPQQKLTLLLYVFQGSATVNGAVELAKGESLIIKDETDLSIKSDRAELVLFATDETAEVYKGGMYSGNQA